MIAPPRSIAVGLKGKFHNVECQAKWWCASSRGRSATSPRILVVDDMQDNLDLQMPDHDGHHLCTATRMMPDMDDIEVIFLTAERTRGPEIERGLRMGAADYICKPIDGPTLRERVRAVVEHCPSRLAETKG